MPTWSSDQTRRPPLPPLPPPPPSPNVSALLISRVYSLVLEDASTVGVIAVGSLASSLVFAGIAVPAWIWGGVDLFSDSFNPTRWLLYAVAAWAAAFVSVLFSGAVVAAGVARLDGRPITARAALAVAWSRRRQLFAWALVTTVVTMLADQLNRFGLLGGLLRIAADLAWALATLLVLPIIIVEGRMPREAIAESVSLVKGRLGLTVRTKVRLYAPWLAVLVIGLLVTGAGIFTFLHYRQQTPEWAAMGLLLAAIGLLGAVGATFVQGAADALLNTLLYRHALGLPLPGFDAHELPRLVVPPGSTPPAP